MSRISVVSIVMKDNKKKTGVFFPVSSTEIPKTCFKYENEQAHFWLTDDGEPPENGDRCMCGEMGYS